MKYFRLMGESELSKFLRGEILDRENQQKWFLENNVFYFISEEDGGLSKLQEIIQFFLNEEETQYYIIAFESNDILEKIWNEDEEVFESICETYSINNMYPIGYIKSPKDFLFDEWVYNSMISGIPKIPYIKIKNDLSKSFNDRNYIPNRILIKKEILNRRKNRLLKYAL